MTKPPGADGGTAPAADTAPASVTTPVGAGAPDAGETPLRYVVTGGAGFIGSHIAEQLAELGHEVVVVDDFSTGRRENLDGVVDRVELIEGSIVDPAVCAQAVAGADYVIHQAAVPSVPRSVAHPHRSHEANATGTLRLLVAARDAGVRRVVYAGSSPVYGDTEELPKREEMPTRPLSPYAVAKLAGENYCRAFWATYGLETAILRYFNVFGPRQDPSSEYSAVIPKFVTCALRGDAPTIHGDGEQTRDFTYVDNVVRANLLACHASGEVAGKVFNIGCGERISVNRLWSEIRAVTGSTVEASHGPARPGDVRDSLAAIERARRLLGYEPAVRLAEGLERLVAYMSGGGAAGAVEEPSAAGGSHL